MDSLYYDILRYLMEDGRTPKRRIASMLNVDPSSVEVRFKKMMEEEIIKRFALYVDYSALGLERAFASFKGLPEERIKELNGVVAYFTCAEGNTVMEVVARRRDELMETIKVAGQPWKVWIQPPSPSPLPSIDKYLLKVLAEDPRAKEFKVAEALKVSARTVRRHLRHLKTKGVMRVIPIVDLRKVQGIMFSVHTKAADEVKKVVRARPLWETSKGETVTMNYFVKDVAEVRKVSEQVVKLDPDATVTIKTSYDVKTPSWALA
ncbi:winged helix-turn-helix transcriptional regulator [Sulfodiicoccus acidiphilus]|nr:winged helix-turn-helix transcriptional regulator [Sulfodiicoccus acidiphilus]